MVALLWPDFLAFFVADSCRREVPFSGDCGLRRALGGGALDGLGELRVGVHVRVEHDLAAGGGRWSRSCGIPWNAGPAARRRSSLLRGLDGGLRGGELVLGGLELHLGGRELALA